MTNDLTYDQRMIRTCTTLSEAGYEVLLVGRVLPNSVALSPRPFQQKRLSCFFHQGKLFYLEYNLRLLFFLLFKKVDIRLAVDLDTLWPMYLSHKIIGGKLVYDAHEYFTELPEVVNRPLTQWIWSKTAEWLIPGTDACYTVGEALAKIFSVQYGKSFDVIRNVPFKKSLVNGFESKSKNDLPIILYQGVLNRGRGLEEMIEAMKNITDAQLWLAGEGDLSNELRSLVFAAGLESRVRFLGYILPDQLDQITRQAHIGLNLLRNEGLNYYYSLANKTFDYIQQGVPAIHRSFPEYQQLNDRYSIAVLVNDLEPETLTKSIRSLLDDPVFYQQLKDNCLKHRDTLNWENESKKLVELFEGL